jgi:hypothetical protein
MEIHTTIQLVALLSFHVLTIPQGATGASDAASFLRDAEAARVAQSRVARDYVINTTVRRGEALNPDEDTSVNGHLAVWMEGYRSDQQPTWTDKSRGRMTGALTQSFFDGSRLFVFVPKSGSNTEAIMKVGAVTYAAATPFRLAAFGEAKFAKLGERSLFELALAHVDSTSITPGGNGTFLLFSDLGSDGGKVEARVDASRGYRLLSLKVDSPVKASPATAGTARLTLDSVHLTQVGAGWYVDQEEATIVEPGPDGIAVVTHRSYEGSNIASIPETSPLDSASLKIPRGTRGFPLDRTSPVPVEWDGSQLVPSLDPEVFSRMGLGVTRPSPSTRSASASPTNRFQDAAGRGAFLMAAVAGAVLLIVLFGGELILKRLRGRAK